MKVREWPLCSVIRTCSPNYFVGGRYTPFMNNYRPQLFLRTADITVALNFPDGTPDAAEKMVSMVTPFLKRTSIFAPRSCLVTMLRWFVISCMTLQRKSALGK